MTRSLVILPVLLGLWSCAPPPLGDTSPAPPVLHILFPEESDAYVYCSTFMVTVEVENFVFSREHYGGDNVDGEGHWHLLDGDVTIDGTAADWTFITDAHALSDGLHTLTAELEANNHQPLSPEISTSIEITVDDEAIDDPGTENVYEGCNGRGQGGPGF